MAAHAVHACPALPCAGCQRHISVSWRGSSCSDCCISSCSFSSTCSCFSSSSSCCSGLQVANKAGKKPFIWTGPESKEGESEREWVRALRKVWVDLVCGVRFIGQLNMQIELSVLSTKAATTTTTLLSRQLQVSSGSNWLCSGRARLGRDWVVASTST